MDTKKNTSVTPLSTQSKDQNIRAHKQRLGGRSAHVRVSVFEATMEILFEKGYEALSIGEVASRSGVHETSIYRRWKTKERLVSEVLIERIREGILLPDTGAMRSDFVELLKRVATFLKSPLGKVMVQISAAIPDNSAASFERTRYWNSRFAQFALIVERAIARGEVASDTNSRLLLETLIGPLYVRVLLTGEPLDETVCAQIVELVLSGLTRTEAVAQNPQ